MLLAIRLSDRTIAYASANIADTFGLDPDAILRQPLAQILPALGAEFEADLADPPQAGSTRTLRTVRVGTSEGVLPYEAAISRSGECAIIELEAPPSGTLSSIDMLYPTLRRFVDQLQGASTIDVLCRLAAQDIRRMTGFDRVLIYRFDEQWNGTVIAEDRNEVLPSYLDLRFPASDIPAQARDLYRRNRQRIIPDANYTPVPIQSRSADPLDLSDSVLRSVSPVHLEYMRNMGTLASMSISILRDGDLWGLISCHNKEPKRVSLQVRNACDFLTQIFSLQLEARENTALAENRVRLGTVQTRLLAHMAAEDHFIAGLVNHPEDLMLLAGAQGAAVLTQDRCWRLGLTPGEEQVKALFEWLSDHHQEDVFATDRLPQVYPAAQAFADKASGLVAISISKAACELCALVPAGGRPDREMERQSAEGGAGGGRQHQASSPAFLRDLEGDGARAFAALGHERDRGGQGIAQRHRRHRAAPGRGAGGALRGAAPLQQGTRGLLLFGVA